ncbi:sugar phosphate isomerase/epimerase [bacterium]|jgi:D-psicose/D-tagatose/L-ribulose 3-epimerase|nr:sugar phosphate isomerase/epimerase [bacterium]
MKIGMNLLLYTTAPDEKMFPIAEKLKGMGYHGLEWPLMACELPMAKAIGKFNHDIGLEATTVAVFGEGQNPISANQADRTAAYDRLRHYIDCTKAIGGTLLCGPMTQTLGLFSGQGPTREEHDRAVEFLKKAGDYAQQAGIMLSVEYLNRFEQYFINTADQVSALLRDVHHPAVKTMADSFHMNIEEADMRQAIKTLGKDCIHVHISENNRGVPGSSKNIPWDDFFGGLKEIGYDGWLTIEAFGQFLPDLAAAARIWRQIFDSPEHLSRLGIEFIKKSWNA